MSDYHTGSVGRMGLLQLAWPMFIEWLLTVTIGMVDAMILGYISDEAAAAVGGVNVLLILAITLLGTLAGCGGIVLTQYRGGQRRQELPDLNRSLLLINLLAGAALSLLMLLGSPLLPALLLMPTNLHQDATPFAAIVGGGLMAQSLVWAFSSILNAHGQTRLTMANSLTMNIGNALLSLYLVTHTDYGVAGVAWATVLCRLAGALNLYLLVRWRLQIPLQLAPSSWHRPLLWRPIARIAMPACLEPLSYYGNQAVLTAIMASLGVAALAAKSYVLSMVALIEVAAFAISQASQILTGHLTGAGEWHLANRQLPGHESRPAVSPAVATARPVAPLPLQRRPLCRPAPWRGASHHHGRVGVCQPAGRPGRTPGGRPAATARRPALPLLLLHHRAGLPRHESAGAPCRPAPALRPVAADPRGTTGVARRGATSAGTRGSGDGHDRPGAGHH